jgi:alkanesulfonate monooxygenase SsuD/methylene tetrahydromethanopterin reductase-like flavin-dependent oxidoreductase (luciferase family)
VRLGFLVDLRNPTAWHRPWPDHYARSLELVEEADRIGASAIFIGEHHVADDGYIPQPLVFAAAVAARTRSIRVGSALTIAPLRHPMHIAEEAAVVDVLSGGRLELGLGSGYAPAEFAAFGVDRAQRNRLMTAAVPEVRRLLSEVVTPRPVQPRVPIWCGYVGKGARRAGLFGEGLMSMQPDSVALYREGLAAGGHDADAAQLTAPMNFFVSDDPERTLARIRPSIEYHAGQYRLMREAADEAEGRGPTGLVPRPEHYQVLTAEQAITMLRQRVGDLPVVYAFTWLTLAGFPDDVVIEHMRLLVTNVEPAVRDIGRNRS